MIVALANKGSDTTNFTLPFDNDYANSRLGSEDIFDAADSLAKDKSM